MKLLLGIVIGLLIGGAATYFIFCSHKKAGVIGSVKFTAEGSGPISFEEAKSMHKKYMLTCFAAGEDTTTETLRYLSVKRLDIDNLLKSMPPDGSLRIYMGDISGRAAFLARASELTTFLVGADSKGALLINQASINTTTATVDIVDNLPPCPDNCPNGDGFN